MGAGSEEASAVAGLSGAGDLAGDAGGRRRYRPKVVWTRRQAVSAISTVRNVSTARTTQNLAFELRAAVRRSTRARRRARSRR